jgi:hypothetical protein
MPLYKEPISQNITKKDAEASFFIGWAGWIRTIGMTESKSVALPLGDSPIFVKKANSHEFAFLTLWGG